MSTINRLQSWQWRYLGELEAGIRADLPAFLRVLHALEEVADCGLWEGTHGTFDAFVNAITGRAVGPRSPLHLLELHRGHHD